MREWLARLKHDLLKQTVWRARDLRDLGQAPRPSDLAALERAFVTLRDGEGREVTAQALWRELLGEIADPVDDAARSALDRFGRALDAAIVAVADLARRPEDAPAALASVLALEPAFDALARDLTTTSR